MQRTVLSNQSDLIFQIAIKYYMHDVAVALNITKCVILLELRLTDGKRVGTISTEKRTSVRRKEKEENQWA